jgi:cyanate permease
MEVVGIYLLAGFLIPPFIHQFKSRVQSESARFLLSLAISAIVGAGIAYPSLAHGNNWSVAASIGLVFLVSQTVFHLLWKWVASSADVTSAQVQEDVKQAVEGVPAQ